MQNDSKFEEVSKLKYWCYKILPLVYDDSLSYYEVLCKMTKKLNEVINNTNSIPEIISETVANGGFLDNLQEQIAELNDKDSKTATADRKTGQLIWLNGDLYRITRPMLAGDQYIESSDGVTGNIEKATIEDWINRYLGYVKDSIAPEDQEYNVIASKPIKKGTLLWWHGELYAAKVDIALNSYLTVGENLEKINIESILNNLEARLTENDKYPIYYPSEEKMKFKGSLEGSPIIKTTSDVHVYNKDEETIDIIPVGREV